jgi:hypothetical protein
MITIVLVLRSSASAFCAPTGPLNVDVDDAIELLFADRPEGGAALVASASAGGLVNEPAVTQAPGTVKAGGG